MKYSRRAPYLVANSQRRDSSWLALCRTFEPISSVPPETYGQSNLSAPRGFNSASVYGCRRFICGRVVVRGLSFATAPDFSILGVTPPQGDSDPRSSRPDPSDAPHKPATAMLARLHHQHGSHSAPPAPFVSSEGASSQWSTRGRLDDVVVRHEKRLQNGDDITVNLRLKQGESQLDPLPLERSIREAYAEGDVELHVHLRVGLPKGEIRHLCAAFRSLVVGRETRAMRPRR